ncbi:hypothetical protein NDU88_002519 [Pleurodeles waltl]|uniref:Uncharacterized protein n=1 Tax=Pleurodeles waltl TaxID=8319 RepID=A0AAV7VZY0_PLEWA|nr:hypothetical protein NDU88_002519 [Pleurodeles waltl]
MTLFVTPLRLNECNVATLLSNQIDAETRPESTWLKNDTRLVNAVAADVPVLYGVYVFPTEFTARISGRCILLLCHGRIQPESLQTALMSQQSTARKIPDCATVMPQYHGASEFPHRCDVTAVCFQITVMSQIHTTKEFPDCCESSSACSQRTSSLRCYDATGS